MRNRILWVGAVTLLTSCVGRTGRDASVADQWFVDSAASAAETPHGAAVLAFQKSRIVTEKSCLSCHTIGERGGTVGPILDQIANRRSEEWLLKWLADPNKVKPGTKMPNFEFSPGEVDELLSFLLKLEREIPAADILASGGEPAENGRQLLDAYGCKACHRIGDEGRFIGVDLTWVGARKSESWEHQWLKDPAAWK
ncbi:MAG: c-type cytochrome, partial [Candidatus Neomarinimicrobiota bacterium]